MFTACLECFDNFAAEVAGAADDEDFASCSGGVFLSVLSHGNPLSDGGLEGAGINGDWTVTSERRDS